MPFFAVRVLGRAPSEQGVGGMVPWRAVSSDYFRTFHMRLLQGRAFDASDMSAGSALAMVLEPIAGPQALPGRESHWPARHAR